MGINLTTYTYRPPNNISASDITRKIRAVIEARDKRNPDGCVTSGYLEVTQETGGYGWAISDLIPFSYNYTSKPNFTFGNEGTIQPPTGYEYGESVTYSETLPDNITSLYNTCVAGGDFSIYQPAIFGARVIHWWAPGPMTFLGAYILVIQLNPECTEEDKIMRVSFRFEGSGYPVTGVIPEEGE